MIFGIITIVKVMIRSIKRWEMNKTIGILAHVDSGKTTFSEQILYHIKLLEIEEE